MGGSSGRSAQRHPIVGLSKSSGTDGSGFLVRVSSDVWCLLTAPSNLTRPVVLLGEQAWEGQVLFPGELAKLGVEVSPGKC